MKSRNALFFVIKFILWFGYALMIFVNFISIPVYDHKWQYIVYIILFATFSIAIPSIIWYQHSKINHLEKELENIKSIE